MTSRPLKNNNNVVYDCHFHVVFCTKYRRDVLTPEVAARLTEIATEVAAERDFTIEEIKVSADHVHLLIDVDPQYGIHRAVKQIKGRTSRFLRAEFTHITSRIPTLWTNSYFVATAGGAPLDAIKTYIQNQNDV